MVVRTALVDKRAGTAIISRLSRSLAIITTISITSIVSMDTLGASVVVADSMTITWLSRPLAIAISSISITSIVSMQTLGASVCVAYSMAITISRLGISGPLAIISTIPSQALGASVLRAVPTIRMIGNGIDTVTISISIPGLSCTQAGKSYDCCNLSCHGY